MTKNDTYKQIIRIAEQHGFTAAPTLDWGVVIYVPDSEGVLHREYAHTVSECYNALGY